MTPQTSLHKTKYRQSLGTVPDFEKTYQAHYSDIPYEFACNGLQNRQSSHCRLRNDVSGILDLLPLCVVLGVLCQHIDYGSSFRLRDLEGA